MTRPALALIVSALWLAGCGRGEVSGLGLGGVADGGPGASDTGPLPYDGGPGFDAGPGPFDGGPSSDGGPFPTDSGPGPADVGPPPPPPDAGLICRSPRDCLAYGNPPPCPQGAPGAWACNRGICEGRCPMQECVTDCDCDFRLACANGQCLPLNRINNCCLNPDCPPGASCVFPDGVTSFCPDTPPPPPDAGPRDSGGPVPIDGGPDGGFPNFDAGTPPDAATPPDAGPVTPVGDPCVGMDCGPIGFCIDQMQGFPGGYCSQGCGFGMSMCPQGAECLSFGQGNQVCLDSCVANADCRTGYGCVQLGLAQGRVCWPVSPGSTNPMGDPVGSACTVDNDCVTGLECLGLQGWPGGYCTRTYCDPQTNPCPSGSGCYAFPGLYSLCMANCPSGGSQSTCRAGYYCLGPTGAQGACFPN